MPFLLRESTGRLVSDLSGVVAADLSRSDSPKAIGGPHLSESVHSFGVEVSRSPSCSFFIRNRLGHWAAPSVLERFDSVTVGAKALESVRLSQHHVPECDRVVLHAGCTLGATVSVDVVDFEDSPVVIAASTALSAYYREKLDSLRNLIAFAVKSGVFVGHARTLRHA